MTKRFDEDRPTASARGAMPKATGDRRSALSILDEAFRTAGGIEDPAGRVAVLARIAVLRQQAGDAPGCARALSMALAAARDIDDDARALALAGIARARAKTGDRQGWRETAANALKSIAPGPVEGARFCALEELAMAEAEAGDVAAAVVLAERCAKSWDRDRVLGGIARLASTAGKVSRALFAVRAIAGSGERALRLARIAQTQGETGDCAGAAGTINEALEAARQVEDEFDRTLWLVEICRAQVAIGDRPGAARTTAEAVAVARLAEDESDRAHALCHIARNQPALGNLVEPAPLLDEASRAIRRIVDESERAFPLCELAEAAARTGDRPGALRSIAEAWEATKREAGDDGWDVGNIAVAEAIAGEAEAAWATARRLSRHGGSDGRLADICDGLCWGNAVSEAVATAREIVSARARARTLVNIARYQAREGDPDGAGETIVLALEAADAVAKSPERAEALVDVAELALEITAEDGSEGCIS